MSDSDVVSQDLNQVIASAVQARVETEVLAALSGSDVFGRFVQMALHQVIEVKDRDSYKTHQSTYIAEVVKKAIQGATRAAVERVLVEEAPSIEAAVTTELRKNVKVIAAKMVGNVVEKASDPYGISVELRYGGER